MSRIPYRNPSDYTPAASAAVAAAPINVQRMLAGASDRVIAGFGAFMGAFYIGSRLPADLREVAILRVGHLCGSSYEVMQHEALARSIGFTDAMLAALRKGGDHASLSPAQQAVSAFADDIAVNVRAGDETLMAVRSHLDDEQVLDLILVIGAYRMIAGMLETCGVEHDEAPLGWIDRQAAPAS